MTYAYDKVYLSRAQSSLGRMFDFAVYDLHYELSAFFFLFLQSGVASRFEDGDFHILAGMSGVELAYEVLDTLGISYTRITPHYTINRSKEYWTGWALAYYQWRTSLSFSEIVRRVPIGDVQMLYSPYHEMDIRQFCDKMDEMCHEGQPETNLKWLRQKAGISQSQLAKESGVSVRTIQQYEQRKKNINKAKAENVFSLAKALCCNPESLLEKI